MFQSTPANFTAGDGPVARLLRSPPPFQSTPANFTAGDCTACRRQILARRCFNPRPPISQRATRCRRSSARRWRTRFNPRPPISQRATPGRSHEVARGRRFNPRPPISQRATGRARRHRSHCAEFQSTPANFTAGDALTGWMHVKPARFNPRPPISQRATSPAPIRATAAC